MEKAKSSHKYYWKRSAKVTFRTKISSAGQCSAHLLLVTVQKKSLPPKKRNFVVFLSIWEIIASAGEEHLHRLGLPSETSTRKAWCTLKISEMFFLFTCRESNCSAQNDLIIGKWTRLWLLTTTILSICFFSQSSKRYPTVFQTLLMTLVSEFPCKTPWSWISMRWI